MIPFVDTACVTLCPMEALISYNLAKHLWVAVSGRCFEIVHHNFDNLFVQWFIVLLGVQEHDIIEEFLNHLFDQSMIDLCVHGTNEFHEDRCQFECSNLL